MHFGMLNVVVEVVTKVSFVRREVAGGGREAGFQDGSSGVGAESNPRVDRAFEVVARDVGLPKGRSKLLHGGPEPLAANPRGSRDAEFNVAQGDLSRVEEPVESRLRVPASAAEG